MYGLHRVTLSSRAQRHPDLSLDLDPRTVSYTHMGITCMAVYSLNRTIPPKHVSKMDSR